MKLKLAINNSIAYICNMRVDVKRRMPIIADAIERYINGERADDIAKDLGTSRARVCSWVTKYWMPRKGSLIIKRSRV